MSCLEHESEIVDLQDGRLDSARELRFFAHLEGCPSCRARAAAWNRLVPVMRGLAPEPPPPLHLRRMEVEIERRLVGALPPPRRPAPRAIWWGGFAAAAAVALLLWGRRDRDTPPSGAAALRASVRAVSGVVLAGGLPVRPGAWLQASTAVTVEGQSDLDLSLAGGATLALAGPGRLRWEGDPNHVRLVLEQGTLTAAVSHRAPGATFVVQTRDGRVEVRGTRFVVRADSAGSSVTVQEGRVAAFARGGTEQSVSAGQRFVFGAPALPAPAATAVMESTDRTASAAQECRASSGCAVIGQRARALMRAGQPRRAWRLVDDALAAPSDGCAGFASNCQDELRYLKAEALRLDGQLEAAVTAYKALDRRAGPGAMRQNAFYAAAQLEQRLGRPAAARADYERALSAAPAGALREEAMLGALESAASAGDDRAATAAARRYLDAYPGGRGATRAQAVGAPAPAGRGAVP